MTVHVNVALPVNPALSAAVTVTHELPAVVGVPEMVPVTASIDSPVGRPEADQWVMVAAADESVAPIVRGAMAAPDVELWLPGEDTDTVLVTDQLNDAEPL